ncbi:prostate stem cell antigen-like [Colossoma macropomum]|uniref:prostate stem cell antigen-like n=1 Tax=Colossoma macropomum TaxID=42526 RepID=UPI001864AB8B|nr:prostate stem cell antigen-like [Colossoma macropomum]
MKPLVTLMLICLLLSEAFQASAALKCHTCASLVCTTSQCIFGEDHCYTVPASVLGFTLSGKGCATKNLCEGAEVTGMLTCCDTDLCNSAEQVKLSLLIMLVPLISSILLI